MNRNAVRVIAETANSIHQTHPTFLEIAHPDFWLCSRSLARNYISLRSFYFRCYRLNAYADSELLGSNFISSVKALGVEALGRCLGHESRTSPNCARTLIKETLESSLAATL